MSRLNGHIWVTLLPPTRRAVKAVIVRMRGQRCHIAVLETIVNHQVKAATAASDKLIDFVNGMFDVIGRELDPALLDCSLEPLTIE